jgi:hypothetical protein
VTVIKNDKNYEKNEGKASGTGMRRKEKHHHQAVLRYVM